MYKANNYYLNVLNDCILWVPQQQQQNIPLLMLIFFCIGMWVELGAHMFSSNRSFLVLERGPSARSFCPHSFSFPLFHSRFFLCVLDQEWFQELFQGTGWNGLKGEGLTEFTIIQKNFNSTILSHFYYF